MREKFNAQLENNKNVTEESLTLMTNKTYYNGDEVKVGDKPLFGAMLEIDEQDNKQISLIMLCEDQIDLYETDDRDTRDVAHIPMIKLK